MKKLAIAVIAGLVSASAFAAQGDILARFRVINIAPDVKTSDTLSAVHVDVDNQTVPELDFTYMITNNIGAELILATARHEVTSDLGSLGKINHLPPTLTLQYHFNPEGQIRPYVGAGINYTRFYNNDLGSSVTGKVSVDKNSWGGALQVGTDIAVNKDWFVNLDVKKIYIKTDVTSENLGSLGTLKINPWVFGLGVGTKF
ncbi:OmpW family protein [Pseudogulbenkiania sp. NH8B]|uniref:OmpW family protein n=1 Tax=Pseudogulbenkiania ferrooxidans 2002 TaxID=279714 RepID=B9Z8M0_9NEIS|nr:MULTISPECIES: OmpW family protein [Pseudogulbenkiania]EEG06958.1 OmpW family protein [Pseudogulbenkiania ferrooxidans 2002]BAK75275.1 OmpW family protein [Pseudogulbenkiania sp. NH8B]